MEFSLCIPSNAPLHLSGGEAWPTLGGPGNEKHLIPNMLELSLSLSSSAQGYLTSRGSQKALMGAPLLNLKAFWVFMGHFPTIAALLHSPIVKVLLSCVSRMLWVSLITCFLNKVRIFSYERNWQVSRGKLFLYHYEGQI